MAVNPQRISFSTFQDMAAHLDRWAGEKLDNPEAWTQALDGSKDWLDYSPRNQVLLASYAVDGPVAGTETWRLVPSTTADRSCAVRGGEHGFPVRVPITTGGEEPDPYLGGKRPTRATVERWEWRPVFSVAQLARRPEPAALAPATLPDAFTGPDGPDVYLQAIRRVAKSTVRGRLPKGTDPQVVLADAASRMRRNDKRPALDAELCDQVAWLVSDRVDFASGALPAFDPSGLKPRERWERMLDVLEPARKLTAGLGVVAGVDLCASPLPRMEIVDDRVVPAGRRHRLPAASFQNLPIGRWIEVGPYSQSEWSARGEDASGRGAYLRLNGSAYLVATEQGDQASWRLEDDAARTGHGHITTGTAPTLDDARNDAMTGMSSRYPALTASADATEATPAAVDATDRSSEWQPMPGAGNSSAEQRQLTNDVTLYVIPSNGGRWMPAVNIGPGGDIERLKLVRTIGDAREAAELAGRRAIRVATLRSPVGVDGVVAELAASDDYSRVELAAITEARLLPDDHARVVNAEPAELVELLALAGVTPATNVAVLHAEGLEASDVAPLLPSIGVPIADCIRVLQERWDLPIVEASEALDATATEMREAGCTATEIMSSRPRDVLRSLPDDPHLWELAAGTMATAGHPDSQVVSHLVAHAPSVDAFVAGVAVLTDDAATAMVLTTAYGAQAEQVAAVSERFGLSPTETAQALTSLEVSPQMRVEVLWERCDHEADVTRDLAVAHAKLDRPTVRQCLATAGLTGPAEPLTPAALANSVIDIGDADALLARLPTPVHTDPSPATAPTMEPELPLATPQLTGPQQ